MIMHSEQSPLFLNTVLVKSLKETSIKPVEHMTLAEHINVHSFGWYGDEFKPVRLVIMEGLKYDLGEPLVECENTQTSEKLYLLKYELLVEASWVIA